VFYVIIIVFLVVYYVVYKEAVASHSHTCVSCH